MRQQDSHLSKASEMNECLQFCGRLALVKGFSEKSTLIILETPENVTGSGMAVMIIMGTDAPADEPDGAAFAVVFDARCVLTFDQDVRARENGGANVEVYAYQGEGVLDKGDRCDAVLDSRGLGGKWALAAGSISGDGDAVFQKVTNL